MSKKRRLVINVFVTRHGHHPGSWRQAQSPGGGDPDFQYWLDLARTAERGKLDAVFFADFVGMGGDGIKGIERRPHGGSFEPLTLAAALAAATDRIGIVATANTNFNEPYNLARLLSSIDHVSHGRIGWNIVSSLMEGSAKTFGHANPLDHAARYERAAEFVEVAKALWDTWDDGAFGNIDKKRGIYTSADAVHPVHHHGKYFNLDALLDMARPVQGYPVFVQAGNSDTGRDFAAKYAEMIYASAQFIEDAQAFYADIKGRMAKFGRDPDHLKVTPGLSFTIGESEQEAKDKFNALQEAVDFSGPLELMGNDISNIPLDGPLPDLPEPPNGKGRWQQVVNLARRENLTVRQLYLRYNVVRGHRVVIGTPKQVADQIEDWFVNAAADGFNLIPPLMPSSLEDFVNLVVPELQRRDLLRKEYEGTTLREHLGLPRPENQHAVPARKHSVANG